MTDPRQAGRGAGGRLAGRQAGGVVEEDCIHFAGTMTDDLCTAVPLYRCASVPLYRIIGILLMLPDIANYFGGCGWRHAL